VIVITRRKQRLVHALRRFGKRATFVVLSRKAEENGKDVFRCDVSDPKDVEQCFGKIAAAQGKIDILINNAGFGQSGALEFLSPDSLRYISDTNFLGVVYCTKYALPLMKKGRILNISSMSAFVPMLSEQCIPRQIRRQRIYHGYGMELQGTGIDIASVCLGDIRTGFAPDARCCLLPMPGTGTVLLR
jgi:NAD(P)-dependent dehydrogenase (short-subunit alcohol dehydrogenase family)